MRLKLIGCEIFYRELCALVARSVNKVDLEFLPKGLHDLGAKPMLARVQECVDRVNGADYDAVLLGYALCGNGITGLQARSLPLVVPRAHDCITLFLGSKERYQAYFDSHSGVYFKTTGWIERGEKAGELTQLSHRKLGFGYSYEELVEKYGEENAQFLMEQIGDQTRNYGQITFIEMGLEPDGSFQKRAREVADQRGWAYEEIKGDLGLMRRLVDGPWEEPEFLVVPPGRRIAVRYDSSIIGLEEATP